MEKDPLAARREVYESVVSILELNGVQVDLKTKLYMQPLLSGRMTYEEHRAMLKSLLAELPA